MCHLNQKQEGDSLLSLIKYWWPTQKENLSGLRYVDAKEMHRLVALCLEDLHNSDDCNKTAVHLPTKIVAEVEELCENAPANDRKRCAACVCMLVSACMTMINATAIGNRKLMWAQSYLQKKMEQFENVDNLFEELWDYIEEVGAEELAECATILYEGKKGLDENAIAYFPFGFLSLDKVKELYLLLRNKSYIEECVTEDDFLQLFGCKKIEKNISPIKWLLNKDDLLLLLRGIYDKWTIKEKPSWASITSIAHAHFLSKDGTQYNEQMKLKTSYKGENSDISVFLATL